MPPNPKIHRDEIPSLKIIHYPDPHLGEESTVVDEVDAAVRELVDKMFELMSAAQGVGLAASQVGITIRLFIASSTLEDSERGVYVNPEIISVQGAQENEEGCLSLPDVTCKLKRPGIVTIRAMSLDGEVFEQAAEGLLARIFLHELDHLDGRLILDRMGAVAKLANRKTLKELEEQFTGPDV